MRDFHTRTRTVLNEITLRYPAEVWQEVTGYLGPPIDTRAFHITSWLRGGDYFAPESEGALSAMPAEKIWEWVDVNVDKRAWYVASFVPRTLHGNVGRFCLARQVLVRYGEREDVRRNLMANFSTEGWTGDASLHFEIKKNRLLEFRKTEEDDNVKHWIDEYISYLERSIAREKVQEEREEP